MFVSVAAVGLIFGFAVVAISAGSDPADPHPHGPDTHTHGDQEAAPSGMVNDSPPVTFPEFGFDEPPVFEPVLDSNGVAIETENGTMLTMNVAALAAASEQWIVDGGDLIDDPPPDVHDDDWFAEPSSHPLDPRWYAGFEVELRPALDG